MLTQYDKDHIGEIVNGQGTWFTARLIRLICYADQENLWKLGHVYPDEVKAVMDWKHGGSHAS